MRPSMFLLALAMSVAILTSAFAADEYNVGNGLTMGGSPLGTHSIDPASMFEKSAPVTGGAVYTSAHDIVAGKLYLFINPAILEKYREDPQAVIAGANAKWPEIVNSRVSAL